MLEVWLATACLANEMSGDTEQLIIKNDNELLEYRLNNNVIIFIINDFCNL